jgi:hypothetical protein
LACSSDQYSISKEIILTDREEAAGRLALAHHFNGLFGDISGSRRGSGVLADPHDAEAFDPGHARMRLEHDLDAAARAFCLSNIARYASA